MSLLSFSACVASVVVQTASGTGEHIAALVLMMMTSMPGSVMPYVVKTAAGRSTYKAEQGIFCLALAVVVT